MTTLDIYRPFGAGSPTYSAIDCTLVPQFRASRCAVDLPDWTHYVDVDASVDIRDAVTRLVGNNGLTYADGDEVRIPSGVANRYVVVWVEPSPSGGKRVYLMRHAVASWTDL